eukprot:362822-Chlamydomonas_euryale.AAC.1
MLVDRQQSPSCRPSTCQNPCTRARAGCEQARGDEALTACLGGPRGTARVRCFRTPTTGTLVTVTLPSCKQRRHIARYMVYARGRGEDLMAVRSP